MAELSIFDVSSGTGMLSVGVKLALETIGLRGVVVGGCERDSCAAACFLEVMEQTQGFRPPLWDDAQTLFGRRERRLEPVDVVTAGYPCQPFSSAGRRLGHRDPRHLWPAVRRIIARLKPSLVFLENVDGHVTLGLWKVLRDLERLGYEATCGVFSAEEVGAPHLRKRVFIMGYPSGPRLPQPEQPELRGAGRRDEGRAATEPGRTPLFPPHRDDYRRWAQLVTKGLDPSLMPAVESGVPVVADGMAPPSDILRLGGNGVVPLQAAWAFIHLACCLLPPTGERQLSLFTDSVAVNGKPPA